MITGIDYGKHKSAVKNLKKEYQDKLDELTKALEETFKYIYSLPNSEMRQILSLRYIDKLSWQKVAESMGLEGDGSTQRKKHDKFMKRS
jgi:DNA-directed RNA polymerase specialized sigma subunit